MAALEEFTEAEFTEVLSQQLSRLSAGTRKCPCVNPKAVLLGGQSGAGKTTLHEIFSEAFDRNVVIINGDKYRSLHPRFHGVNDAYGIDSPQHTAAWAGRMTEALIDELSKQHYNLIIEGTLRTAETPLKTAGLLRGRGYGVSLAVMAVKPEISLVSCQIRYEQMRNAGTTPRAVNPAHHQAIVESIADNLAVLEESGVFDSIELYTRSKRRVFPREDDAGSAAQTLQQALYGPWTAEEEYHYAFLQDMLAALQHGRSAPANNQSDLQSDKQQTLVGLEYAAADFQTWRQQNSVVAGHKLSDDDLLLIELTEKHDM